MKINCQKAALMNGINIVSKAVSSKSTMPNLQCILIEASYQEIRFLANDIELGIETLVEGTIIEPGKIALDAKMFSDIVRKLPDSEVMIETNSTYQTNIRCERSKFNIPGLSGEDFNYLPEVEKQKYITLSQFSLREMIRQTIFSISDHENARVMNGELFEVKGDHLRMISMDGFRISIRNLQLKESYESMKVIVPGKTLNEVSKILSGGPEDDVKIYVTDKHILFEFEQTKVVSRLIEGEFYDKIDMMLTRDYETKFEINKKEFLNCIDRASLFIKESDKKPIIMQIESSNIYMRIDSSLGSMNEEIEIRKEGKDLKVGFNPKFLMDALRVIDDDTVTIYMIDPNSPCFIRDAENTYVYLIMTMRLAV